MSPFVQLVPTTSYKLNAVIPDITPHTVVKVHWCGALGVSASDGRFYMIKLGRLSDNAWYLSNVGGARPDICILECSLKRYGNV